MPTHANIERLARELCDSRYGSGHYDKPSTHRGYWCRKAAQILGVVEVSPPLKALWQACGWPV